MAKECACGCGQLIAERNKNGPVNFVKGHHIPVRVRRNPNSKRFTSHAHQKTKRAQLLQKLKNNPAAIAELDVWAFLDGWK